MQMKKSRVSGKRADLLLTVSFTLLVFTVNVPGLAAPAGDQPFRLLASSTAADLGNTLTAGLAKRDGSKPVHCQACDSRHAMTCLTNHECDVALVVRSLAGGASVRKRFEELPLAQYAIAVVVNAKRPVRSMTRGELADVFQGKIMLWDGVEQSRDVQRIELFSPSVLRTESYVFRRRVMLDAPFAQDLRDSAGDAGRQKRYPDEVVGAVIGNGGGIGFFQIGTEATMDKRVRLLAISLHNGEKPVVPTADTIADGSYPIVDRLTLYLHPDAPQTAKEFCEFAVGPEGAKIVRQYDLWPEYELEEARARLRLKNSQAGEGVTIRVCGNDAAEALAQGLAVSYVKVRAAAHVEYRKRDSDLLAMEEFLDWGELFLGEGNAPDVESRALEVALATAPAKVGVRAVGVLVHPDNDVRELTIEDLQQIYSGTIDKWPGAEGAAARIRIVGLPSSSPIMRIAREKIGRAGKQASIERRNDTRAVMLSVAAQPGAIGLVDLSQVPKRDTRVRLVNVVSAGAKTAQPPAPDAVPSDYPLTRPVMLYLSHRASKTTNDFFEFVAEGNAREALLAHGIIPNPNPPKFTKDKTLAAVNKHFDEEKPTTESPPMAPEAEELAIAIPKGPAAEEEATTETEESPPEDTPIKAEDRTEGKPPSAEKKSQKTEAGSEGADTKYFIFGMAGLLIVGVAFIGVNAVAAKRRRERLRKYRR